MVEIKKVIALFEKALPVYEEVLKRKNISFKMLKFLEIHLGFCRLFMRNKSEFKTSLNAFSKKGYYRNYLLQSCYITESAFEVLVNNRIESKKQTNLYHESLTFRRDFLKTEIKSLKSLLKKGYTHI